jgi:hypothetical protein
MMVQEPGVDGDAKCDIWIKTCPNFDVISQHLTNLGTEVKIALPMSNNDLTNAKEYIQ